MSTERDPMLQNESEEAGSTLGAPVDPNAKKKSGKAGSTGKKMNTRTVTLIGVAVALVVLAVALVVLLQQLPEAGTTSSEASTAPTEYVVNKLKDSEGKAITITDLVITSDAETLTFYTNEDKELTLKGMEDMTLRTTYIDLLVSALSRIPVQGKITVDEENPLSAYGLDEPQITADITFSDGEKLTLEMGNMTPLNDGYYLYNATSEQYAIVSTNVGLNLLQKATDYLDVTMFSSPAIDEDDENGSVVLYGMTLGGTVRKEPISFTIREADDLSVSSVYTYKTTAPYLHGVNSAAVQNITYFTSLSAISIANIAPSAEELEEYGLTNPYSTCDLVLAVETYGDGADDTSTYYNKQSHSLRIGKYDKETNCYYTLLDDFETVYLVSADSLTDFIDIQYIDLVDSLLFAQDITAVESVTVGMNGESHRFDLSHFPEETEKDDKLKVSCNGNALSTPDFRTLYTLMMQLGRSAEATEDMTAEGTPILSLKVQLTGEDAPLLDVEFFKATSSLYLCRHIDTGETYCVKASSIDKILNQTTKYLAGESVTMG